MSHWEGTGKSDEWYTPKCVFDALETSFDLDVAPARYGPSQVPVARILYGDGLTEPWEGFVWMNPPFGGRNALAPWLGKFIMHGNGIALVPDRTSAPWFQDAARLADALLFTRKLRFLRPDGTEGKSPSNGTALMAMGRNGVEALLMAHAKGFGMFVSPWWDAAKLGARTLREQAA